MDKNIVLAFGLSFAVIFIYFTVFPPPDEKPEVPRVEAPLNAAPSSASTDSGATFLSSGDSRDGVEIPQKTVTVSTPLYEVVFNSSDAYAESFVLKNYAYASRPKTPIYETVWNFVSGRGNAEPVYNPDRKVNMVGDVHPLKSKPFHFMLGPQDVSVPFSTGDDRVEVSDRPRSLEFKGVSADGLEVLKTLTFHPDSYVIDVAVRAENVTGSNKVISPVFRVGAGNESIESSYNPQPKEGMVLVDTSLEKVDADEEGERFRNFHWAAVSSTYFISGVLSEEKGWTATFTPVDSMLQGRSNFAPVLDLVREGEALPADRVFSENFKVYMGPKLSSELEKFSPDFGESLDLVFNFLARPMLFGLRWFHGMVGNWGVAIILLTVAVRIVIFPLALKGMKSMKRMQKMGPKMQKLKEQYGKNKDKLNKEMMQLYKRNKINPVGGCLPLLMQIPIFIALYWALLPALELRHEPFFFWIRDLSAMDHTLVLPILMGLTMFIQQHITPMSAAMDPMQQKLFKFFPLAMILFFITFPSGLVLYWVTSNVITILQQLLFNRVKIKDVID